MSDAALEGIELLEEAQEEVVQETEYDDALNTYLDFGEIEGMNDVEGEEKMIRDVEELQYLDKMYKFVNQELTAEELNNYANKCLSYIGSNEREFKNIVDRSGNIKAQNMFIESDDDDFI